MTDYKDLKTWSKRDFELIAILLRVEASEYRGGSMWQDAEILAEALGLANHFRIAERAYA